GGARAWRRGMLTRVCVCVGGEGGRGLSFRRNGFAESSMKCFAAVLFLFAMIGAVRGASYVDAETQLIFPDDCGGWSRTTTQEYPEKELGFSIGYRRAADKTLTVYVYSRGY